MTVINYDCTGDLQSLKDEYEQHSKDVATACDEIQCRPYVGNWFMAEVDKIRDYVPMWKQQVQSLLLVQEEAGTDVQLVKASLAHIKEVQHQLATAHAAL